VENLSSSNVTKLNGKPLNSPAPIKAGDELKFGRVTIVVDSLYESDSRDAGGLDKGTVFINK
jgi:pSer/pThr/pTyr-binding forkhead associated (FHA) protein